MLKRAMGVPSRERYYPKRGLIALILAHGVGTTPGKSMIELKIYVLELAIRDTKDGI